ncbi:MAG TPA: HAMP domain-containing sensor histidine kinase [Rhizomicrobium sp.]|nr:HAMP domain-containing sensor histidine kinase [Rhizomicrobium sp.]
MRRSADVRVLNAQLDLVAAAMRMTRFTSPLWALALAWLGSDSFGLLGHRPFAQTIFLPVVVAITMFLASNVVSFYQMTTAGQTDYEAVRPWFARMTVLQVVISAIWGLVPWLLWDPASQMNHIFLAGATLAMLSTLIVSRATHMDMFLAGLVPMSTIAALRFAFGDTMLDYGCALVIPAFAAQLFFDGRRLARRVDEDARLRFQVEDLARELEETRDEALRKRFEAETANASKTAFLANMSHELRTPLNAILGFSEIIHQECFGPVGSQRYKEYAGDIHSSGAHLLSLINDLLDVAKIEAGKMDIAPHPLDARRTFDIALKLIGAKARERSQTLAIEIDAACPPLYADERALKQILINLCSNAVKFTPEGGKIIVRAEPARCGGFQISVQDNGPGIPREKLDKIFTPFSQVDNRYDRQAGGTGLGLALVRGLAELHGGRAWLESEYGKGSCAYVVLPASQPETQGEDETVAA